MKSFTIGVATAALGVIVAGAAFAQTPLSLTLDEALARGVAHAPRLAEARARESAASSTVAAKTALRLPSVAAMADYMRTNHVEEFGIIQPNGTPRIVFPDIPNNYRVRAQVDVPVLPIALAENTIESARADARATSADVRSAEQDVRLEITRAYWTLVMARESVSVLEQAQARADAWLKDVGARVDAGVLPPNDRLSAQAQRARQSVQLIQARNVAAAAEIDLARLIGADLSQAIAPVTPVDQPIAGAAEAARQPVATLVSRALEQRTERAGLRERQASLTASGAAALATLQPRLSARVGVEPSRPNPRFAPRADEWRTSWDAAVNLVWPLWDGGQARANHAAAVSQAEAVGHRLEDFDAAVAVDIRQRLLDLQSNRAALAASDEAVAAATEARRVLDERFNAGVATPTDVLDAQLALLNAELEHTQLAAALRLGEARLLRAVGGL